MAVSGCEALARGGRATYAVWPVGAASAEEAIGIVHGTVRRAWEVWWSELLVWADDDRNRDFPEAPFPASWTRP